ncbi:DUF1176 domain-containing protein [Sphingobium algorifonticola]|uniref:DUF1176 domain-containing protein n=1 Tax=Sphingobium algorifonticola TaxID=2008318 RepID=UPI001F4991E6|nr:DUF1176 domain-containing protein [Sphingobium algorifonticola]
MKIAIALGVAVHLATGASVAAAAAPQPGKLETYRDWTIGCDNGRTCAAEALLPADAVFDGHVAITLSRAPQAQAQPVVSVRSQDSIKGSVSIVIDGKAIASAVATDDEAQFTGVQGTAIADAMARGKTMEVRHGKALLGKPSLSGSAAALRYMDAQQGRAGTVTAIVAKGPLGANAVKPPPPLPLVTRAVVPPGAAPSSLWREELAKATDVSGCADEFTADQEPELHRLSKTQTLVLMPCGAGAYNFSSVPLIATGMPGRRSFMPARFDLQPGWSEDAGLPMLVNAGFEAKTSSLSSYAKGRGIGDCGSSETYVWDGTMFRLTEATQMGECRGGWNWITTWRAKVVP